MLELPVATRCRAVDPLTALGNRRAFDEALPEELARARRTERPLSLLMIDVDHFKAFNDRHGHLAGDEALADVARVLSGAARAEDRACRVGGEDLRAAADARLYAAKEGGRNLVAGAASEERRPDRAA